MTYDSIIIGQAIYAKLSVIAGLSVYPSRIPQDGVYPCAVYEVKTTNAEDVKERVSVCDTVTVEIGIYATTIASVSTLTQSVLGAIDELSGEQSGVTFDGCHFANERNEFDPDLRVYGKKIDCVFRVKI